MQSLSMCPSCEGLVPRDQLTCPHCDTPTPPKRRSRVVAALAFVSAGAASVTLMACYGMPPCDYKAADGSTKTGGVYCKDQCVDPNSEVAKNCYQVVETDGGTDGGLTTDGGRSDSGSADGG